ncbi:MAG: carboxypeptidase regulatory-like domain-containing protein [Bacteroides sp.]|nr:carboxypeptidase regulatory-like domain-containing protein [Bacteroides sp.]
MRCKYLHKPNRAGSYQNPFLIFVFACFILVSIVSCSIRTISVKGRVIDPSGEAMAGAIVRVRTDSMHVLSDSAGYFVLNKIPASNSTRITAWKKGYYVSGVEVGQNHGDLGLVLYKHQTGDNEDYQWLEAKRQDRNIFENTSTAFGLFLANNPPFKSVFHGLNESLETACDDCHGKGMYGEWINGAHSLGNRNLRFMSMYNGTDVLGNKSAGIRYQYSRDYGSIPMPAYQDSTYYGPGYKLDYPNSAGNCAACHLPAAAINRPYDTDPNEITGINSQGSHCDFCHKISDIVLNPVTQVPFNNMPGVLSYTFVRPYDKKQVFFGPYDDVDAGEDICLPLMKQSEYCAGCHDATFWGIPIYKSFSEWYNSPYREKGISCQDCHMAPDGHTTNFARRRGGLDRNPESIASHRFDGAMDHELLRNSVSMTVKPIMVDSGLRISVVIDNNKTGHHVPTDSPLRNVILLVKAEDNTLGELKIIDGPRIPKWGGVGDPEKGYYAGNPGKIFAKVLEELWTGNFPSGAYWVPTRIRSDNRIAANSSDQSDYLFEFPSGDTIGIQVQLLYRRAPKKLMDQKKWNTPDILMNEYKTMLVFKENKLNMAEKPIRPKP